MVISVQQYIYRYQSILPCQTASVCVNRDGIPQLHGYSVIGYAVWCQYSSHFELREDY